MDPLSIAATVISLMETGLKLKNSVDQVAKTRGRARELAEDVHSDLLHIAMFYERNRRYLASEALGPLRDSLHRLKRDLHRLHERCRRYESKPEHSVPNRFKAAMLMWINSNDIEADLVRLQNRIQASLNAMVLLSCARMEVGILRIQEDALLSPHGHRTRLRQLDCTFAKGIYDGDPGLAFLKKFSTEIDQIDIAYIRLKATMVVEALSNPGFARAPIERHLFAARPEPYIRRKNGENGSGSHIDILTFLIRLSARLSRGTKLSTAFRLIVVTSENFCLLGCPDVAWSMMNALESLVRRFLVSSTATSQKVHLLWALEIILIHKATLIKLPRLDKDTETYAVAEDQKIECIFKGIQVCRTRIEHSTRLYNPPATLLHRLELVRYIQDLIYIYYKAGRVEDCTNSCLEALELLSIADLSHEDLGLAEAYVLQLRSHTLYRLAWAQRFSAQYTLAYHTGLQCVASIEALSRIKIALPKDFRSLYYHRSRLEQGFHSLTSIVREPSQSTSRIEEYLEDDGSQLVQWGIAI
ncbi:hypothetical protein ONZ45_g13522 [Pleurotus djamor]|nr:hypothetical protein ONZ45_g13522 [Pleurotus djamor]